MGATKKWERLESYGPKFTENAVQAIARDILMYAMQTLSHCSMEDLENARKELDKTSGRKTVTQKMFRVV